ncbi:hypothetical protein DFH27DRAFT_609020 [Peziza echinospora]|nr:hypothetical protein DFH27DRAFT_609020 [Peziza echinospora]
MEDTNMNSLFFGNENGSWNEFFGSTPSESGNRIDIDNEIQNAPQEPEVAKRVEMPAQVPQQPTISSLQLPQATAQDEILPPPPSKALALVQHPPTEAQASRNIMPELLHQQNFYIPEIIAHSTTTRSLIPPQIGTFDGFAVYQPLRPWGRSRFNYDEIGQLAEDVTFDEVSLREFIYEHPLRHTLIMWVQKQPVREKVPHPIKNGYASTCRYRHCMPPKKGGRVIDYGHYRIGFDELTGLIPNHKADQYVHAAFLHVSCFEKLVDACDVVRKFDFRMENRKYLNQRAGSSSEENNRMLLEQRQVPGKCTQWILNARSVLHWKPSGPKDSLNYTLFEAKWALRPHRRKDPKVPGMEGIDLDPQLTSPRPVNNDGGKWGGVRIKGLTVKEMREKLEREGRPLPQIAPKRDQKRRTPCYETVKGSGTATSPHRLYDSSPESKRTTSHGKRQREYTEYYQDSSSPLDVPPQHQPSAQRYSTYLPPAHTHANYYPPQVTSASRAASDHIGRIIATDTGQYFFSPMGTWERVVKNTSPPSRNPNKRLKVEHNLHHLSTPRGYGYTSPSITNNMNGTTYDQRNTAQMSVQADSGNYAFGNRMANYSQPQVYHPAAAAPVAPMMTTTPQKPAMVTSPNGHSGYRKPEDEWLPPQTFSGYVASSPATMVDMFVNYTDQSTPSAAMTPGQQQQTAFAHVVGCTPVSVRHSQPGDQVLQQFECQQQTDAAVAIDPALFQDGMITDDFFDMPDFDMSNFE